MHDNYTSWLVKDPPNALGGGGERSLDWGVLSKCRDAATARAPALKKSLSGEGIYYSDSPTHFFFFEDIKFYSMG